jgi:hypothetical protein
MVDTGSDNGGDAMTALMRKRYAIVDRHYRISASSLSSQS